MGKAGKTFNTEKVNDGISFDNYTVTDSISDWPTVHTDGAALKTERATVAFRTHRI
jgi:hypothetical protein